MGAMGASGLLGAWDEEMLLVRVRIVPWFHLVSGLLLEWVEETLPVRVRMVPWFHLVSGRFAVWIDGRRFKLDLGGYERGLGVLLLALFLLLNVLRC